MCPPTPYAESGAARVAAIANLATVGTGATPSQKQAEAYVKTVTQSNLAPVTLTGTFATIALLAIDTVTGQKIVLDALLAALQIGTGEANLSLDIFVNGASILNAGAGIGQSLDALGTNVTCNWKTVITGLTTGTQTITVRGKASGDGTLQIPTGNGSLVAQVVTL